MDNKYLVKSQVHTNQRFLKEKDGTNVKIYLFTNQCHCGKKIGVGGFSKILRNFQSWLWQLTRWGGGVKKGQKYAYVIFEWSLIQFLK